MSSTSLDPTISFRNERPYPFCPGCGHGPILNALDAALSKRASDPSRVVIVSDIGCSGLSDQYFRTSAFHGLHGRSITYATGIKLANPDLDVIVIMGDGGTGIGGAHLLAAARRNIGITVLVLDNLNFGMTGGQHSTTTPLHALTPTTPVGNLERPLDICGTVAINGAQYVWRGTSFDEELTETIVAAMDCEGFALLDIWELCTAYYTKRNAFSRRAMQETMDGFGLRSGLLADNNAPEYAAEYRRRVAAADLATVPPATIATEYISTLADRADVVVAGAAGGRVRSAVRLGGEAAIASGIWAAQHDDYPITVKTGHSVSSLVLSTRQIAYPGIDAPDLAVVVAPEGRAKVQRMLGAMGPGSTVITVPDLAPIETAADVVVIDPADAPIRLPKGDLALALLTAGAQRLDLFPIEAMIHRAEQLDPRFAERTVEVIETGKVLGR